MKIQFPRLGIESITANIDEEDQYAKFTTIASSRIANSSDLRLLALELVAMTNELDAARPPPQAEVAREMVDEYVI